MTSKQSTSMFKKEDEYFLQHPSEQLFYKVIAFVMGVFGLNSEYWSWFHRPSSFAYDIQRYIVIIFVPITSGSQVLYLYLHYSEHEFAALAVMFSIMPVAFVVMIKSAAAQTPSYKKAIADLMDKIHLYNYFQRDYTEQKCKFIAQELIQVEKRVRQTFVLIMSAVFICYSSWNTVPIIHNVQNNPSIHNITTRLEVCVHFWQPFDYEFNFYAYLFIQILGIYCGGVAVILMVIFDTVNLMFIYHLVGHIQIIKYDLKTDFTEKKMNSVELKERLVKIAKYYSFITDTFQDVEAAFGLNVASVYAQNLIQGGLLLYQLMTTGKNLEIILTYGLMIPIFMGILMLISFDLENVRIQAEDIPTLVYDIPWESMDIPNQKILQSILFQVQPTLEFKAAFNIKTGVQPAINIIKTTFSYYVMIKSRM